MILSEEETLDFLKKEEQISIRIRADKNNPNYVTECVYVNGVAIQIPGGEDVKVSKTVRDLLLRKGII